MRPFFLFLAVLGLLWGGYSLYQSKLASSGSGGDSSQLDPCSAKGPAQSDTPAATNETNGGGEPLLAISENIFTDLPTLYEPNFDEPDIADPTSTLIQLAAVPDNNGHRSALTRQANRILQQAYKERQVYMTEYRALCRRTFHGFSALERQRTKQKFINAHLGRWREYANQERAKVNLALQQAFALSPVATPKN